QIMRAHAHGEERFPRIGDHDYEWTFPAGSTGVPIPEAYTVWFDRLTLEDQELTLETVTNPTIKALFEAAQRGNGYTKPETTPEAILKAVFEAIKYETSNHEGAAPV